MKGAAKPAVTNVNTAPTTKPAICFHFGMDLGGGGDKLKL
jgi:hypothetical protein